MTEAKAKVKRKIFGALDSTYEPEVALLCEQINALPGLQTTSATSGKGTAPLTIWFRVDVREHRGLFVLARSVDRRYWQPGYQWSINVDVNDEPASPLPISYRLSSEATTLGKHCAVVGDEAYEQAVDLVSNIRFHLGHKNFLSLFGLPPDALAQWGT